MNTIRIPTVREGVVEGTVNNSVFNIDFLRTSRGHYSNTPMKRGFCVIPTEDSKIQLRNVPLMLDKENSRTMLIPFEWTLSMFLDFDVFNDHIMCSRKDTCLSFDCSKIELRGTPVYPVFSSQAELDMYASGEYKLQYTDVDFEKEVFVYAKT